MVKESQVRRMIHQILHEAKGWWDNPDDKDDIESIVSQLKKGTLIKVSGTDAFYDTKESYIMRVGGDVDEDGDVDGYMPEARREWFLYCLSHANVDTTILSLSEEYGWYLSSKSLSSRVKNIDIPNATVEILDADVFPSSMRSP